MKVSALLVGFFPYLHAITAFQSHGFLPPRSASLSHVVLGGHGDVVNNDPTTSVSVTTRQAFLAKALIATSSLPSLLGGIPSAFADDIAGAFDFFLRSDVCSQDRLFS